MIYFFRTIIILILISLFNQNVNAAGAATDIPFVLSGYMTFQGPTPAADAGQINMTCKVIMPARTNAIDKQAVITAAKFESGYPFCVASTGGVNTLPWSLVWPQNNTSSDVTISNVWFSTAVGDCFGDVKGTRIATIQDNGIVADPYKNQIMIKNQVVGNCSLSGVLEIVSYPNLN